MDKKNISLSDFKGDLAKRWYIQYYDESGKRHRLYGNMNRCHDLKSRKAAAHELLQSILQEKTEAEKNQPKILLSSALQERLDLICIGMRKKTIQCRESTLRVFLQWTRKNKFMYLHEFGQKQAEQFLLHLSKKSLHNTTLNGYLERMTLFSSGIQENNPFAAIRHFPAYTTPAKPYTTQQVEQLRTIISLQDPQLWLFIRLMHNCLIRPNSELRVLKIQDVDLERKRILVKATISKNKKHQYVLIPEYFLPELEFIKAYPPDYYLFSTDGKPGEKPPHYNYFYNRHLKYLKELGIYSTDEKYQLYSWKHTGVVSMVRNGVPMKEIQLQGRWHSLDQLDEYLRSLGLEDMPNIQKFKGI